MSIETLEERFQQLQYSIQFTRAHLFLCALKASAIQIHMRAILSEVVPDLCGSCENKCCEGFPLEGWFSIEDYVLFRLRYEKPAIPLNHIMRPTACSFLTPAGCSLPADMRPFTCVKVNCERLNDVLRHTGKEQHFNVLRKGLDAIHRDVSKIINGTMQSPVDCSNQDAGDAPSMNICAG